MSINIRTTENILFVDLFDGRLERYRVREHIKPEDTSNKTRILTDGENFLWVFAAEDGSLDCMTRYAPNGHPGRILVAIAKSFDTEIFSVHDPQYWGFDTQVVWEHDWDKIEEESEAEAEFYDSFMKYINGEPHNLEPGSYDEEGANLAKEKLKPTCTRLGVLGVENADLVDAVIGP